VPRFFATLQTERLLLRPPRRDDVDAIHGWGRDPEVTRWVAWPRHESRDDAHAFVEAVLSSNEDPEAPMVHVAVRHDTGEVIGSTGLSPDHGVQIGYVLARRHWGQGFATELACALVDAAWSTPDVRRVWAICDLENLASARVLEKCGMQREGVLRRYAVHPNLGPEPRDCAVYAVVRGPG
jgi:[ribosomal protein S5]-alanine N-acetyltransferase